MKILSQKDIPKMSKQEKKEQSNKVKEQYERYPFPNDEADKIEDLNKYHWIINPLKKIEPNKKIIEVGCGTGEISCFLSKFGQVTGTDFSNKSVQIANQLKKKLNIQNVNFYLDNITEKKQRAKFDYIFCIGVLHHIPNVEIAIENLKAMMDSNSLMVISVYNRYAYFFHNLKRKFRIFRRYKNLSREIDYNYHVYEKFYSRKELIELMERNNLEILGFWKNIPEIVRLVTGRNKMMNILVRLNGDEEK